MNAIKHFLESWWILPLIFALPAVTIWRSARRIARLDAAEFNIPRHDTPNLRTNAPFRRADFAAKAEIVRKGTVMGTAISMVVLLAWYPSLVAISRLLPTLPHGALIAYQVILFVVAMGSLFVSAARGSRLARRSGLICPACGIELVGTSGRRRFQKQVEDRVLETGKCPGCGAQLLDPSEVGSVSETLTPAEHAQYIGLIAVLVAGIIVMTYLGHAQVKANAWNRCRRLYARAYSASDSVVIDSTRLDRGYRREGARIIKVRATCDYFRRTHDL